jgi:hypothetical protein
LFRDFVVDDRRNPRLFSAFRSSRALLHQYDVCRGTSVCLDPLPKLTSWFLRSD